MATEIARPLVPQPAADVQICECASALDRTLRFRAHSLCIARLLHRIDRIYGAIRGGALRMRGR